MKVELKTIIDRQRTEYSKYDLLHLPEIIVVVLIDGDITRFQCTMESIHKQTYKACKIITMTWNQIHQNNSFSFIKKDENKYYLFLKEGSMLLENTLLEYAVAASKNTDIIYGDEAVWNNEIKEILCYRAKPDFSFVSYYSHLFLGQAVLFQGSLLCEKCQELRYSGNDLETLLNDIELQIITENTRIIHISKLLLLIGNVIQPVQSKVEEWIREKFAAMQIPLYPKLQLCDHTSWVKLYPMRELFDGHEVSLVIIGQSSIEIDTTLYYISLYEQLRVMELIVVTEEKEINHLMYENAKVVHVPYHDYDKKFKQGLNQATRKYCLVMKSGVYPILNYDILTLCHCFLLKNTGAVSPRIIHNADQVIYSSTISWIHGISEGEEKEDCNCYDRGLRETEVLSSDCCLITKEIYNQIVSEIEPDLDEESFIAELSFNIWKHGASCIYCGESTMRSSGERPNLRLPDKITDFWRKWTEWFGNEPYTTKEMIYSIGAYNGKRLLYYQGQRKLNRQQNQKQILVISHELSMTGAPIVLCNALEVIKEEGYWITVISPENGPLRNDILKLADELIIDEKLYKNDDWLNYASSSDLIIVNTVVPYTCISALESLDIPVIWWLHDAREGFEEHMQYVLPESVSSLIHIYCVSEYAKKVVTDYRPEYSVGLLPYGLPDELQKYETLSEGNKKEQQKLTFLNVGTIENRKGQDILVKSIKMLSKEEIVKARFIFVGKKVSETIYQEIEALQKEYPDNVQIIAYLSRDGMFKLYTTVDCVICSSRDDPLPTFLSEAMMMRKVCICSENTGSYYFIEEGKNGYTYRNNDPVLLKKCIEKVINRVDDLEEISKKSRITYENNFSIHSFHKQLKEIVTYYLEGQGTADGEK